MKKIIIVGAGFVGMQLARTLVAEGRSVVLIDKDATRVKEVGNQIDCAVVHSTGNSPAALYEAGIESADALIAVTEQDEVNMITCSYVDAHYPGVFKIARVRNYDYYESARKMSEGDKSVYGIDRAIHPNVVAADAILTAVRNGLIGETIELESDFGIVYLTLGENSPGVGKKLREIGAMGGALVVSVERGVESFLPNGETVLLAGDHIGILARTEEFAAIREFVGVEGALTRRTLIYGAGQIGRILAADKNLKKITVVDTDGERCRKFAEDFSRAEVLCGSLTEEDIINEEGLDKSDLFVAVSDNYDQNLVVAAYMKSIGVRKTIALTASSALGAIARKLGVDVAIPMRDTVVDGIMSNMRGRGITNVHTVCGGAFEILTCRVGEKAKAVGMALKDLSLQDVCIVLLAESEEDKTMCVPHGEHVIRAGERVVLIVSKDDQRFVRMFGG